MPSDVHILNANTPDARPNINSLLNNNTFRHDAEDYVSDMGKGMHDPAWLKDAWAAHERRAAGDFDEFYLRKIEVDWGADIPDEHRPEHLRAKKDVEASAPVGEEEDGGESVKYCSTICGSVGDDDQSMVDAPEAETGVMEQNGFSVNNGKLRPNGAVKDDDVTCTNGIESQTSKRKASNDTPGLADSVTATPEKFAKSHSGFRFEVIPDDIEAKEVAGHKETANRPANGTKTSDTAHGAVAFTKKNVEITDSDIEAWGDEIIVGGSAMELDGQVD